MKKNLFLMAFAAIAMLATSCQKENGNEPDQAADTKLKVRIANVGAKSRAIGAPAESNQIALNDGIIFIMNATGEVTYKEVIKTSEITGVGQVLAQQINKTDKVYIVGNLTTDLTTKLTAATDLTLDKINAELLSITSTVGQDYAKVTLANSDALPKEIIVDSGAGTATVSVNIAPVYSRIELASVVGADNTNNTLTSFNVVGVYVTDYYLQYTLGGSFGGAIYEQKQNTDFSPVDATMKNEGTWASSGTSPNITAVPEAGKAWVYNVPADALPRLIVKLGSVVGTMNSTPIDNKAYFLTLTGYSKAGVAITKMDRAKIYRIEKLNFNLDQITPKPNENLVNLTVTVTIDDWAIEVVDGDL